MSKSGNAGSDLVPKSEQVTGAVTMQQDEFHFLQGHAFSQSERFTFAAAEVKWFLFDPTSFTPGPSQVVGEIIARVPAFFAASGPIEVDFYSAPTLGAAVPTLLALPSFNRVATSPIVAQLTLSSLNIAPSSLGAPISQLLIPANAAGVGQQTGFSTVETLPFSLDLTKTLLMVVTNLDGNGTEVAIRHGWFEI
jgi:hypothetical protein